MQPVRPGPDGSEPNRCPAVSNRTPAGMTSFLRPVIAILYSFCTVFRSAFVLLILPSILPGVVRFFRLHWFDHAGQEVHGNKHARHQSGKPANHRTGTMIAAGGAPAVAPGIASGTEIRPKETAKPIPQSAKTAAMNTVRFKAIHPPCRHAGRENGIRRGARIASENYRGRTRDCPLSEDRFLDMDQIRPRERRVRPPGCGCSRRRFSKPEGPLALRHRSPVGRQAGC